MGQKPESAFVRVYGRQDPVALVFARKRVGELYYLEGAEWQQKLEPLGRPRVLIM